MNYRHDITQDSFQIYSDLEVNYYNIVQVYLKITLTWPHMICNGMTFQDNYDLLKPFQFLTYQHVKSMDFHVGIFGND